MARTNKIILIIGRRGTGKTDFCKKLVKASTLPKKLIIDTFDNPPWHNLKTFDDEAGANIYIPTMEIEDLPFHKQGLYRCFSSDTDYLQSEIDIHVKNSLIVFEDATRYFPSRLTKSQKNYLLNSKQNNTDIVLVFHFMATVPPDIVKMADYIVLFKTNEGHFDNKKYFHPEMKEAFDLIAKSKNNYENVTICTQ